MKKILRKITLFGLIAIMALVPVAAHAGVVSFRDVGDNHWAAASIAAVTELGIMTGDLSGNFNPNGSVDM
ncbi:MAG: S-layer homology domain-containing protein, partial [Defluviitaleaceae bacterium]|nr:S-layer homology domain-containing protein [Defluviitaleaceae bacterium]